MRWVEEHPWKMGLIACFIITFLSALDYSLNFNPNYWGSFFSWIPILWGLIFLVPSINFLFQIKTKHLKRTKT